MLALDTTNRENAIKITKETMDYLDAIKIGYPLVLSEGLEIVMDIKEISGLEVICDFKVADIPPTNEKIANITLDYADGIICHGFVGSDSVKAIQNIAKLKKPVKKVIMVTEMSHNGAIEYLQPISNKLAEMAKRLKVDGVVAPSTRPHRLKEIKDIVKDIPIITPGVGAQGGNLNDILNILTEKDSVIIGRSIYESANPELAAMKYYNKIKSKSIGKN